MKENTDTLDGIKNCYFVLQKMPLESEKANYRVQTIFVIQISEKKDLNPELKQKQDNKK